uniref:hypothetical protein n=1 Tax=Gordonia sp. HS-NH1 TaxID=1435068 RepID=UPI000ACF1FFC
MTVSTAESARRAIETFFGIHASSVITLRLPDGYFGKPYDNYYTLENTDTHGPRIEIGLGYGLTLTLIPTDF